MKNKTICMNYTIGYQPYRVDDLLNFLLQQRIEQLVDTRKNAISRQYDFHKTTLSALCNKVHIEYIHIPELGIPSLWRQKLKTEEDYKNLFERYETEILDKQTHILLKLAKHATQRPLALMCRELEHEHCHRSRLAIRLSKINGLPVRELNDLYARAV